MSSATRTVNFSKTELAMVHATVRQLGQKLSPPDEPAALAAAEATDLLLLYAQQLRVHFPGSAGIDDTEQVVLAAQIRLMENKSALFTIKRALDLAEVRWMVVKGPVIAARFYPAEWARHYNDLDIVVHPDDLGVALAVLTGAGATMLDQNWAMIARKRQGEVSLVLGPTLIDLHWHLYSAPSIRRRCHVDMRSVLGRRQRLSASGLTIPTMDDLDGLIFLATHAILSGGHKARWMIDFAFAFDAIKPEPARLFDRARTHDAALQLAVMIHRVERSLDVALCRPQEFLVPSERLWLALCAVTGRVAPVENELVGTLSGRAVFSATRDRLGASLTAAGRNALDAVRTRRSPGSGDDIDRSLLHSPGGTTQDRETWLRTAAAEGGGGPSEQE